MRIRWPDRTFFAPVILPVIERVQLKFGFPSQRESIRIAKFVYRTGGWLWSRFKWQRALQFAMMAEDLDPVHFPHWAEVERDATAVCPVCGGLTQPSPDGWYAVPTNDR